MTPLQAVKSKDGREMVEAMLAEIERGASDGSLPMDAAIIKEHRARLGLG